MRQGTFSNISFKPQLMRHQTWPTDRYKQLCQDSSVTFFWKGE